MRRNVGGMLLLNNLCLAMRIQPLVLIRRVSEFVTNICVPAVKFAFLELTVGTNRRSVLHLKLILVIDGRKLNWCP